MVGIVHKYKTKIVTYISTKGRTVKNTTKNILKSLNPVKSREIFTIVSFNENFKVYFSKANTRTRLELSRRGRETVNTKTFKNNIMEETNSKII